MREQLRLAVDRVMAEGSLYRPRSSRRSRSKQAQRRHAWRRSFCVRAYRDDAAAPRLARCRSRPRAMRLARRISRGVQGPAGRPAPRPDVRLQPAATRFRAAKRPRRRRPRRRRRAVPECHAPSATRAARWPRSLVEAEAEPPGQRASRRTSRASRFRFPPRAPRGCRTLARADEGLPARARLFDPTRLRATRTRSRASCAYGDRRSRMHRARRARLSGRRRRGGAHRMPDDQPVRGQRQDPPAAVHPRLRSRASAAASARRWRWRSSTARCSAPRSSARR
ncbi:MAG: hypothetical protein RML56_11645 [Burkholderiales bacterium]|nr:hypothetical protein [Burkholderiales bacterium]